MKLLHMICLCALLAQLTACQSKATAPQAVVQPVTEKREDPRPQPSPSGSVVITPYQLEPIQRIRL